jgi:hypothetical protein
MIVIVHPNHDAEKDAQRWHSGSGVDDESRRTLNDSLLEEGGFDTLVDLLERQTVRILSLDSCPIIMSTSGSGLVLPKQTALASRVPTLLALSMTDCPGRFLELYS